MGIDRRAVLTVAAIYAASHALYWWLGVRFDASTLAGYMQFIDVELLANRLLESLWYYHANPPLLNLFAGVGLKVFGAGAPAFFAVVFHLLGLMTAIAVHVLTRALADSRLAADIATAILVFSPSFVLYENWLMYSFPAAALLTASAVLLHRYASTGAARWGAAFFGVLAVLLLTRSLFHLGWLVMVTGLLALAMRGRRRQVLVCAALPILAVALWYGKNYYLFGTFASSTWFGLGLSNVSTLLVTRQELEPLVQRGELSQYALVSRYAQMDRLFARQPGSTGVPVLDQVRKSTGPYNFNNQQVVAIDRDYTADGLRVIRAFPKSYAVGLIISNRLFFSPSSMNLYFSPANLAAALPAETVFNRLFYGVPARPGLLEQPHFGFAGTYYLTVNTSLALILAWWLALGYGYAQARKIVPGTDPARRPRALVIGFIVFTALYVYAVATAFELGENYRYRWVVEPLFLVLAAAAATHGLRLARAGLVRARARLAG
jgi:hypothetical protein